MTFHGPVNQKRRGDHTLRNRLAKVRFPQGDWEAYTWMLGLIHVQADVSCALGPFPRTRQHATPQEAARCKCWMPPRDSKTAAMQLPYT